MNKPGRVFLLFLILVMMLGTIGCKETFNSEWKNDTIIVDGLNKDWNNHGKYFLEDVGMSFGMTNNADSLYLLMQFRDVKTHKMFARSGATIWFCQDGEKEKKLGYKYYGNELIAFNDQPQMRPPQGMDQSREMPQGFNGMPGGKEMMGGGMPDNAEHYNKILVVDGEEEIFESLKENGPIGPHAGCGYSEGVFVYEFVFPLKQEYSYSLDLDPGQEVLVCIDFPPSMPSSSSNRSGGPGGGGPGGGGGMGGPPGGGGGGGGGGSMGGGGGMPGGGMGGGPGGGGPGGGGPGGGGPGETNLKPRTMWFSLQLAPEAE